MYLFVPVSVLCFHIYVKFIVFFFGVSGKFPKDLHTYVVLGNDHSI